MQSLIKLQKDIYERLVKARRNFKKTPKERLTQIYIAIRLENVEKLWLQFNNYHEKLYQDTDADELEATIYVKEEMYINAEEFYIDFKCELKSMLSSFEIDQGQNSQVNINSNPSDTSRLCNNAKLPKIIIPMFNGNYLEWTTFRDLFVSLIDQNPSIDNVQKLQYLKGYLSGEAEQLLRNMPICDANYKRCWELLSSRYNNKKYLSHYILQRLFSQKSAQSESAQHIKNLVDTTIDCLSALGNIGVNVTSWDIIIIHIITLKLDPESRKQWELNITSNNSNDELPTFTQFKEFLTNRYRALEFLDSRPYPNNKNFSTNNKHKIFHTANFECQYCSEGHKLSLCKKFAALDIDTRRNFVMQSGLCFNCFGSHSVRSCQSQNSCRICNRRHHYLIHPQRNTWTSSNESPNTNNTRAVNVALETPYPGGVGESGEDDCVDEPLTSCFSFGVGDQVLLATALVDAESIIRTTHTIRALVDQGSQASFITEATVQYLGLKKIKITNPFTRLGEGQSTLHSNSMVYVTIHSRVNKNWTMKVRAYVLRNITGFLPSKVINRHDWNNVQELKLADDQFHVPNKIDMLLGAGVHGKIITGKIKRGSSGAPIAQETYLGWILSGEIRTTKGECFSNLVVMHTKIEEDEALQRFWELESETKYKKMHLTEEEENCERLFENTTRRDQTGRYIVRLPFKTNNPECIYGNSRMIAEKRLLALEKRLNRDIDLKIKYKQVMEEYVQLGHMERVQQDDQNMRAVYLPHHAVIRDDKQTTKVRVVFDASCKGTNGVSLNDNLMKGPILQQELRHLLMRWRTHPIILSADVVKMYRQVKVAEEDTDYQRLLWRDGENSEIEEFKLVRVTFGTASAPYLAIKALQQTAHDEGNDYPETQKIILTDFYVDDLLTGCENKEQGYKIYKEITEILHRGGFQLQKWTSNNKELLVKINEEDLGHLKEEHQGRDKLTMKIDNTRKILGLTWNQATDEFQYSVSLTPLEEPISKRNIISDIARLFDPLGWAAPTVIRAKMIIQKLWLAGLNWDEEVPAKILNEWLTYRKNLVDLEIIRVPRWLGLRTNNTEVTLQGFSDASKFAYAAVVYVRVVNSNGSTHVKLVTARTKVAPLKQVSIPRLELCGAVLLTRLLNEVAEVMELDKNNIHAWTDSTVVLSWLNSHPSRWQTFVANRVAEIITTLSSNHWSHVTSSQNPADLASRGVSPDELATTSMWFEGPNFLKGKLNYTKPKDVDTNLEEVRVHFAASDQSLFLKYSSLNKLVRIVAYCKRFLNSKRRIPQEEERRGFLKQAELKEALETCIRHFQGEHFSDEISIVKQKGKRNIKGQLKSLNPFLDSNGILRVGGRLAMSELSEDVKHPILIPRSHLANLLVADAHDKTCHGGPQLMLNYLSSKYFIINCKQILKRHVRHCIKCIRYKAVSHKQLMGQLPTARTTPCKPFRCSGVDYAGPIQIRTTKGRGHRSYKGYICLFVCMATRAVHIEVASDLTSQGFLLAFKRFVARRGHCSDIWSDNGTNFVGASRELKELFSIEKSSMIKEIAESLANNNTTWHFIPPRAPHFGGLWEAGVRSVKFHLRRVIGETTLTYEELSTILAQIEACLNSRPLSLLNNDENNFSALTPGHFLVGEPLIVAPDTKFEEFGICNLRRWQHIQKMLQIFWRRWSHEYLTKFLHRYKWAYQNPEPAVGSIVLVKEEDLPPCRWLLGRVTQKHPGADSLTRVVSIQTKDNVIKRPITKICILPITD